MNGNWIIHYDPALWKDDGDIYIGVKHPDGTISQVTKMEFERYEEGTRFPVPSMPSGVAMIPKGNLKFMQAALDEAWKHGLRPTGHDSSQTEFEALSRHLEDMRSIAFGQLGFVKP